MLIYCITHTTHFIYPHPLHQESNSVFNWGSYLALGSTIEIVFWIWSCFADVMVEGVTLKKFWKKLAWSLRVCWTGVHPLYDDDDVMFPVGSLERQLGDAHTPLIGTDPSTCPFFILWKKKGDLDWYHKAK
jgi:hypothetical protein